MELAVTKLAIICFLVIGVSHIVQPRVWARFFIDLHGKGEVGSFLNAFVHFPLGFMIVSFHNVWTVPQIFLTLIGWSLVLKSSIYFIFPGLGVKMLGRVSMDRAWEFMVAGVFSVVIGVSLIFLLLRS